VDPAVSEWVQQRAAAALQKQGTQLGPGKGEETHGELLRTRGCARWGRAWLAGSMLCAAVGLTLCFLLACTGSCVSLPRLRAAASMRWKLYIAATQGCPASLHMAVSQHSNSRLSNILPACISCALGALYATSATPLRNCSTDGPCSAWHCTIVRPSQHMPATGLSCAPTNVAPYPSLPRHRSLPHVFTPASLQAAASVPQQAPPQPPDRRLQLPQTPP
jgi:hypothetical protein